MDGSIILLAVYMAVSRESAVRDRVVKGQKGQIM